MVEAVYGSLPFPEQSAFFRRKLGIPTRSWLDIQAAEHDWAFMVAGANRSDLVADFQQAIARAIDEGTTLEAFRRDFDRIVETYGWDYNGGRNWRSRVIYETNLRTSYQAGRYEQLQAVKARRPYWMYRHSDAVEHPRPEHQAWDGMILHADDPWWVYYFPVNAWGCQCFVVSLSAADLAAMGRDGPDQAPPIEWEERVIGQRSPGGPRIVRVPKGIDPGFEYTPGRSRLESRMPSEIEGGLGSSADAPGVPGTRPADPLPAPRRVSADRLLPPGQSDEEYLDAFLGAFGAARDAPAVFTDVVGERLVIGAALFMNRATGGLKVGKRGRDRYLMVLADTIREPDEIWARIEYQAARDAFVVRRRYLAHYVLPDGAGGVAVFEHGPDGWIGVTTFPAADAAYLERLRRGVRLYRRGE